MDYGMPTLIETDTLEECATLCRELGLQFIELNMNLPQYQLNQMDIGHFKNVAEKYGIYYTIHLDENLNVSDFNPYVADAYRKTVIDTIKIAKQLDVPVLNMHLSRGVYFTLPDHRVYLYDQYKEQYLDSLVTFRDVCEKAIGKALVKISIENSDGYTEFQKEGLEVLLKSPVFSLTYDIGHNHAIGGIDEQVIRNYDNRLIHMHVHDARNQKNHLALGTGELDLQRYIRIAKEHKCRVVLETKTINGLKQSVAWLNNNT